MVMVAVLIFVAVSVEAQVKLGSEVEQERQARQGILFSVQSRASRGHRAIILKRLYLGA